MPPKKRKAAVKQEESPRKQQKQDGQKAVSHDIHVPVDEAFHEDGKLFLSSTLSSNPDTASYWRATGD